MDPGLEIQFQGVDGWQVRPPLWAPSLQRKTGQALPLQGRWRMDERSLTCPERAELMAGGAKGLCLSHYKTGADDHMPIS